MNMELITSRKNAYITHIRTLAKDARYRTEQQEFVCDGIKFLKEALQFGAEVTSVLWKESVQNVEGLSCTKQLAAPADLFDYASPMANSPGPLFTVRMQQEDLLPAPANALILENVQDPGNVGTVIRTASAFSTGAVVLTGACADLWHPKTVRATMGAIFRQRVLRIERDDLQEVLAGWQLELYGAVLSPRAESVLQKDLSHAAVAVGSEGQGLTGELRSLCKGEVIIPMDPKSESLNAAVAASVLMWEMRGRE